MSDWIEKVHALADGELTGPEKTEVQAAVASDPHLSAELEWATLFKSRLSQKLPPVDNEEAWKQCQVRFDAIDKVTRTEQFVGRYAWAFCLIFLVGIFSAATLSRTGVSRPVGTEHTAGLFNDLKPFSFNGSSEAIDSMRLKVGRAPMLSPSVARVTEVATGMVDGRRAGRLTLNDGRGAILLFMIEKATGFEGMDNPDSGFRCGSMNDFQVVTWMDSGYLMMLVGPRNTAELKTLAEEIRRPR